MLDRDMSRRGHSVISMPARSFSCSWQSLLQMLLSLRESMNVTQCVLHDTSGKDKQPAAHKADELVQKSQLQTAADSHGHMATVHQKALDRSCVTGELGVTAASLDSFGLKVSQQPLTAALTQFRT